YECTGARTLDLNLSSIRGYLLDHRGRPVPFEIGEARESRKYQTFRNSLSDTTASCTADAFFPFYFRLNARILVRVGIVLPLLLDPFCHWKPVFWDELLDISMGRDLG
ncbi:unnamed protein product, partial [Laminaria digitata]